MKKKALLITVLLLSLAALALPNRTKRLFAYHEKQALASGWQRVTVEVGGEQRQLMWKAPKGQWRGAIVALHGGGGSYSNFASNIRLGQAMVEFGQQALERGFAVFSLDSGWNLAKDSEGRGFGKRWDCFAREQGNNVDLPFIEKVLDEVIPAKRPAGSGPSLFLTGISNGGYMTILAASHFPNKVVAFAPVSAGDPYGTELDLATEPRWERDTAPGVFRDRASGLKISEVGAGKSDRNELAWPEPGSVNMPSFKQFHHEGDLIVEVSNMHKANRQLLIHGFKDKGAVVLKAGGRKSLQKHFWMPEYNGPILDFFESMLP